MGKTKAYHSSFWNVAKPLILSTLCGCAMIAALLAIAGFVLLKLGQIQPSVTSGIVIVISALSALFSGLVVGRTAKQNGLMFLELIHQQEQQLQQKELSMLFRKLLIKQSRREIR